MGLSDKARAFPSQLSGGQQQRVGITRALAAKPRYLLCDEATSALDPETTASVLAPLADINRQLGVTIVLITHKLSVVKAICDHAVLMVQGQIMESRAMSTLLATPDSQLRRALLPDYAAEQAFLRRHGVIEVSNLMQGRLSWDEFIALMWNATLETGYMVGLAALFTVLIGLPLGVVLFITRSDGVAPLSWLNRGLSAVINVGRSLPFVVLLIALIPLTRLIVGTTLGSMAAIVPITIGAFPFFSRVVENALDEVERGRIEAIQSMGGSLWHVIGKVLLPEALPTILAGVIGLGGLGDLAIRYGYQRFNDQVMAGTVVVLVILVQGVQSIGDRLVRALAHRL